MKIFKLILTNTTFSLIATAISVLTLQFLILPFVSKTLSIETFGMILTLLALKNIFSQTIGGSLNNLKLITHDFQYDKEENKINVLLILSILLTFPLVLLTVYFFGNALNLLDYFALVIAIELAIINLYGTTYFRIRFTYKNLMMMNIFNGCGMLVGTYLFSFHGFWSLIFLFGEITSTLFLFKFTPLRNDIIKGFNFKRLTSSEKSLVADYISLVFSNMIKNIVTYFDRIMINPMLGERAVSQFYIAALPAKTISMVVTPINGVLLSYGSKYKNSLSNSFLVIITPFILLFFVLGISLLSFISPWLINLLYPHLFSEAEKYIQIANFVVMTGIVGSLLNPYILSKCELKWQYRINLMFGSIYMILGFILTSYFGLIGFCTAAIISNILKIILTYIVGIFTVKS